MATHLHSEWGYERISFAAPLKAMARELLTWLYGPSAAADMIYDNDLKVATLPGFPEKITPRYIMQTLGTEWGRELIHRDLWVTAALAQVERDPASRFVIDDVRFFNEYSAIRGLGGQVWRIERPGVERQNDHPSEGQLENNIFDQNFRNNSSVDRLLGRVNNALRG